jgi:hypothetical protein
MQLKNCRLPTTVYTHITGKQINCCNCILGMKTLHSCRLDTVCSHNGKKVDMPMENDAKVFTLNSSSLTSPYFSCHLDLSLPSSSYGFSVFIEEMSFSGSGSECSEDFLQFGRDILFVTSHLSGKYCGKVARPRQETYLAVPSLYISQRNYVEEYDSEMDIWLHIKVLPNHTGPYKTLSLKVNPFKYSCNVKDDLYRKCGKSGTCIKEELWCDGRENCPTTGGVFEGEQLYRFLL